MKKKKFRWPLLIVGILLALYLIARFTGMLQFFTIPTNSSKPNINPGEYVIVSSLVSPKRFDQIVFKYYDSLMMEKQHRSYRLCGLPGDTVEIKNGELFVNNKSTDTLFDVCREYNIAAKDMEAVAAIIKPDENELVPTGSDSAITVLSSADCGKLKAQRIVYSRRIAPVEEKNQDIAKKYGQEWNHDHFGPYIIPAGHYFVLGDNRNRAQDSRYIGPIPIKDFYGTVISK